MISNIQIFIIGHKVVEYIFYNKLILSLGMDVYSSSLY